MINWNPLFSTKTHRSRLNRSCTNEKWVGTVYRFRWRVANDPSTNSHRITVFYYVLCFATARKSDPDIRVQADMFINIAALNARTRRLLNWLINAGFRYAGVYGRGTRSQMSENRRKRAEEDERMRRDQSGNSEDDPSTVIGSNGQYRYFHTSRLPFKDDPHNHKLHSLTLLLWFFDFFFLFFLPQQAVLRVAIRV